MELTYFAKVVEVCSACSFDTIGFFGQVDGVKVGVSASVSCCTTAVILVEVFGAIGFALFPPFLDGTPTDRAK